MDPQEEMRWVDTLAGARRRAELSIDSWSPDHALRAATIARSAPWLQPGALLALARGTTTMEPVIGAATVSAVSRARNNPSGQRPGSVIRGGQLDPGNPVLFGRERERFYMQNVAPALERESQRARREEAFLGRAPGDMREGVSLLDDLTRQGLVAGGQLHSPRAVRGEFTPERFIEEYGDDPQAQSFIDAITQLGGNRTKVGFVDADGRAGVYDPMRGKLYPADFYTEAPPMSLGEVAAMAGRAVPEVGRFMEDRHLPTFGDIPGVRDTGFADIPTATVQTGGPPSITEAIQAEFMVLNAPLQEGTGMVRNAVGELSGRDVDWWEAQSDLLISSETGIEPGGGFFIDPASELARERRRRERERGQIYGQNITIGRLVTGALANKNIIEPDSRPYRILSGLVDAAVALYVDPTAVGAGRAANVSTARHLFLGGDTIEEFVKPILSTDALRYTGGRLGIKGAARMNRATLVDAIRTNASLINDLPVREQRNLFRHLGVPRRLADADIHVEDPANIIRSLTGDIRTTKITPAEIRERSGLIRGLFSPKVHGETRDAWFAGTIGSGVVDNVASETNGGEMWRRLGRKLRPAEVYAMKHATEPEQVRDLLRPMLGVQFRRTDEVWQQPSRVIEPIVESRALTDIPAPYLNLSDQDELMWQTERWLRNVRADEDTQLRFLDEMVEAQGRDLDTLDVAERMVDWSLENVGFRDPRHRLQMVQAWRSSVDNARQSLLDEITDESLLDEMTLGDETFPVGNPFDFAEHAQHIIALPDARELRRLGSRIAPLIARRDAQLRLPISAVLWWQEQVWKPFTLLRAAWTMRVVPEEALRMAAKGHASMFKDPASFAVWAAGRKQDLLDQPFTEARKFQDAQSVGSGGWAAERPGRIRTGRQIRVNKTDDRFFEVAADNLVELHNDEIARQVAMSPDLDTVEAWLNTDGAEALATLRARHPNVMNEPGATRAYLEMTARHLDYRTGGNTELLDAVRTGTLRGKPIVREGGLAPAKELPGQLNSYFDALPDALIGDELITYGGRRQGFVEFLFANLMGKPTNYLSRSPEFKQSYYDRVAEMITFASPSEKARIIASAERNLAAGPGGVFGRRAINRMRKTEAKGDLSLEQIDEVAKGYALDEVQDLLYDLSRRSQIADSMRLVSPFGEAWREVITRWATLLNPTTARGVRNIRRIGQVVPAARGQDFGEVMGVPEQWDARHERWIQPGFFWRDEFNEEIFIYPGSQWLMERNARLPDWLPGLGGMGTPGIPVPLTGRVEGLNMVGNVFPGLGPVAAVPVSYFLPDKPGWQRTLREFALPFGSVTEQGSAAILDLINYAPPWLRGFTQAVLGGGYDQHTNRIWANSTMATANYLYSTGTYDTTTKAGQQQLMEDAIKAAKNVYLIRSMVAFGAPAAPSPEFMVETNDRLVRLAALRDDYYAMLQRDARTADEEFLNRWGDLLADPGKDKVGMTMQAFTREIQGGIGVSQEWEDWANANPDLERDYSAIWAFFGPQGGDFDYDVYWRQILSGERQQLNLEQWMAFGQNHLGLMLKDHAESLMPPDPTPEDDDWLDSTELWIRENYPGYGDPTGRVERADLETVIFEIDRAMDDDRITSTATGEALRQYWQARAQVQEVAESFGYETFRTADDLEADRQWLFEGGQELARRDLGFRALWFRHLRSEVEPEEGEVELGAA